MLPCEIARERFYQWLDTQYKRGDEMLAERQMALKYGVNRGALREMMKILEAKGCISNRHGRAKVYIKSSFGSEEHF